MQSQLKVANSKPKRFSRKVNPLGKFERMAVLNPYVITERRKRLRADAKRADPNKFVPKNPKKVKPAPVKKAKKAAAAAVAPAKGAKGAAAAPAKKSRRSAYAQLLRKLD